MEKVDKSLNVVINKIKKMGGNSDDITIRELSIGKEVIACIYLESVSSDDKISDFIMKSIGLEIRDRKKNIFDNLFHLLENTISSSKVNVVEDFDEVFFYLASGFTCIFVNGCERFLAFETKATLDRGVTEASTEPIIRGPKDSFCENHMINLGLIRKRIKDSNLWFDTVQVGKRSKTKVTISYIRDIVELEKVDTIKKRLMNIDIDAIIDSGYIRELLVGKQDSSFPKMVSSERPDLAAISLLQGKVVVFVENSPFALIMPAVLADYLHSPDDYYEKPSNVSFTRIIRVLAFIITLFTPAIYIAITTYNHEVIPDKLLISLAIQREGIPFPTAFEVLMLSIIFEVLRECDLRTPNAMGTSISIVGALVLGEAAVTADLVSPMVVIVVAITAICSLLFIDIDFINGIRFWRFVLMAFSTFMGLVGVVVGGTLLVIKLASLESLGTPYLSPFAPLSFQDLKDSIVRFKLKSRPERPAYLQDNDKVRMEVHNEN